MAQGGVSGILDYTAGGNVFGILGGGIRTESGHEEQNLELSYGEQYGDWVSFKKAFKNVPEIMISNFKTDNDYFSFLRIDATNEGFYPMISNEGTRGQQSGTISFDWTATGK